MENTVEQELQHYFKQLNEAEQKSVLEMIKTFVHTRTQPPDAAALDQYNKEIDEALAEAAQGKYISQEELEKQAAQW